MTRFIRQSNRIAWKECRSENSNGNNIEMRNFFFPFYFLFDGKTNEQKLVHTNLKWFVFCFLFMYLNKYSSICLLSRSFLASSCPLIRWWLKFSIGNHISAVRRCFQCVTKLKFTWNSTTSRKIPKEKGELHTPRRKTFVQLINNLNVDNFLHKYLLQTQCWVNMLRANRKKRLFCCCRQTGAFNCDFNAVHSKPFCFMWCPLFERIFSTVRSFSVFLLLQCVRQCRLRFPPLVVPQYCWHKNTGK